MPPDKKSALVQITAPGNDVVGAGFICYRSNDSVLIATSSSVLDLAAAGADRKTAGVDGKYEAMVVFDPPAREPAGISILRCDSFELRDRAWLQLARPRLLTETRILGLWKIRIGTKWLPERPHMPGYSLVSESPDDFEMRNVAEFRVTPNHYGSPVLDSDRVVGVVAELRASPSPGSQSDELIVAASVEQLAREWPDGPADLIHDPLKARRSPVVFFSYAHEDQEIVLAVAERLEQNGITVQLDRAIIVPGDDFVARIMEALDRVDFVAFFVSQNFLHSKWTKDELDITVQRRNAAEKPVIAIPIVLSRLDDIPVALRHIDCITLTNPNDVERGVWEFVRAILRHRALG